MAHRHRDTPDIQSASCLFPSERVVKVIIYLVRSLHMSCS